MSSPSLGDCAANNGVYPVLFGDPGSNLVEMTGATGLLAPLSRTGVCASVDASTPARTVALMGGTAALDDDGVGWGAEPWPAAVDDEDDDDGNDALLTPLVCRSSDESAAVPVERTCPTKNVSVKE